MTFEIALVLAILAVALVAFLMEWGAPELVSMTAFCALVFTGILEMREAAAVFSNEAPLVIAGLFVLTAALQYTGSMGVLAEFLGRITRPHPTSALALLCTLVATASAFVNNTPVVALFLPIFIALARRFDIPASKLLIPLSYAAVLGGCCTLIGTSTNVLVSGLIRSYGQPPLALFELSWIGVPITVMGILYIVTLGPRWLPERQSVSSLLKARTRASNVCHILIDEDSPLVGRPFTDSPFSNRNAFTVLEIRRGGARLGTPLRELIIEKFDRILCAVAERHTVKSPGTDEPRLSREFEREWGLTTLSHVPTTIMEVVIGKGSHLIGHTLKSINFRQTYGIFVMALHRGAQNFTNRFQDTEIELGDTLLLLVPDPAIPELLESGDFLFVEETQGPPFRPLAGWTAVAAIVSVVALGAFEIAPLTLIVLSACLLLLWTRCIQLDEAYRSIDWSILFLIWGMLAFGAAMEKTGAAGLIANVCVQGVIFAFPDVWVPVLALSACYLVTSVLTEVLSNNATAVVMTPIAINIAYQLECDPRPFIVATCIAASAAFVLPMGYQTHLMVYGPGGYRPRDFATFGIPLNIFCWITASLLIPRIWPLQPL